MDSAEDKTTGEIVDSSQLWFINLTEGVDNLRYQCRGCKERVTPCSYEKGRKKRPYFRIEPKHGQNCDVEGQEKLIKKARTERLTTLNGFPCSIPNRLTLEDTRTVTSENGIPSIPRSSRGQDSSLNNSHPQSSTRKRAYTVKTIRSICKTFLDLPYDRDLPLSIPGISGNTYQAIFQELQRSLIVRYDHPKILYGELFWKYSPKKNSDGSIEIQLAYGQWIKREEDGKNQLTRPYRLRIGNNKWSTAKQAYVARELDTSRTEAEENWKAKGPSKAWVFFVGDQDKDDPALFHIHDHRLICCIVDKMIRSKRPSIHSKRPKATR